MISLDYDALQQIVANKSIFSFFSVLLRRFAQFPHFGWPLWEPGVQWRLFHSQYERSSLDVLSTIFFGTITLSKMCRNLCTCVIFVHTFRKHDRSQTWCLTLSEAVWYHHLDLSNSGPLHHGKIGANRMFHGQICINCVFYCCWTIQIHT